MKIYVHESEQFSTFELKGNPCLRKIIAEHLYINDKSEREMIADNVFELLETAYDEIGGFKSFKNISAFINDSYMWYITYDGKLDSLDNFDVNKVYAVSVFRNRFGLKMVGMTGNRFLSLLDDREKRVEMRQKAKSAIIQHIKFVASVGWAEVSGRLETLFAKNLPWSAVILPEELIEHKVFKNITFDIDNLHYYRPIRTGEEPTRKIAYGKIRF